MNCTLVKRFTRLFKVRITEAELELKSGNSFTSLTFFIQGVENYSRYVCCVLSVVSAFCFVLS